MITTFYFYFVECQHKIYTSGYSQWVTDRFVGPFLYESMAKQYKSKYDEQHKTSKYRARVERMEPDADSFESLIKELARMYVSNHGTEAAERLIEL